MIIIPNRETKTLRQSNRSKILGTLWSSFNIDLQSSLGLMRVSPRLRINTSGATNQGRAVAMRFFDQRIFAICGTRIFKNSANNLTSTFVEDSSTGAQTDYVASQSDMDIFNTALVTTTADAVMSKEFNTSGTGDWTQRATLAASSGIHKLCYFQKFDRIYFFDSDHRIRSMDTSWVQANSGDYFLDLTNSYGIFNTMATDIDNIWIGTIVINVSNTLRTMEGANILRWDGISNAVYEYKIKASGILALCKDDNNVMHAIDTNGALLKYSGSGFVEIDRLPLNRELFKNATVYGYNNFIHPNGFTFTRNGTFKILINNLIGDNSGTIEENIPSGIWEWSRDNGFVHRGSATLNSLANSTITDFGQNRVSGVGALYEPNFYSESSSGKSTTICGIDYYSDASTAVSGIFVDDPLDSLQKYGYIVTPWIFSNQLRDSWQKAWVKVRRLLDSDDKLVLKYRTTEEEPIEISITWASTTGFTTSTNLSSYIGYEVEGIQGTGSGKCSHITAVNDNGDGTYGVTVDETYTGVSSGTAKVRLQNWTKAGSFTSQSSSSASFFIMATSERIQLKLCMQFKGDDEVYEIDVSNRGHQSLNA